MATQAACAASAGRCGAIAGDACSIVCTLLWLRKQQNNWQAVHRSTPRVGQLPLDAPSAECLMSDMMNRRQSWCWNILSA